VKISYCIATYRRPVKLRNTLNSIFAQDDAEIDVIVNDNDPDGSASKITEEFNSRQIQYYKNAENIGMVGNFNAALRHAGGDYVVMITDDDPIEVDHALSLRKLASAYPGKGAYFCFGRSFTANEDLAKFYRIPIGRNSEKTDLAIRQYDGRRFVLDFFSGNIQGYMLWSCGFVRRDIAQRIKMPDYGTPYLTDFAYLALACGAEGVVIQNKIIGWQEIHADNFGRKEVPEIGAAIDGFKSLAKNRWQDDREIMVALHSFLARWVGGHFGFLLKYTSSISGKKEVLSQYIKTVFTYKLYGGVFNFSLSLLPASVYGFLRYYKRLFRG
jgi:glycosyltransferase involved in cell wall biosynthesis